MKKWFLSRKVSQKLMLISIFFVMPDSLMLYLFITGINENIRFAQLEKKGNEYQRPLEELLEFLPQHRRMAQRALRGEPRILQQLSGRQTQIEAAFEALEAVDRQIGSELQFTDEGLAKRKREHYRVRTVRKEWHDLKTRLPELTPEACAQRHLHLIADVRTMITHAGDLSNLILDPDLDSYYAMDVTLLALPQTQDRLATVMAHGEAILNRQTLSHAERQQLTIDATLLKQADLDRISSSLQTALNEDANFYGSSPTLQARVPPALREYQAAAQGFINLTTRLIGSDHIDLTAEEYLAAGSKACEASFKLWKIADDELDTLLEKRIGFYKQRRARSLMVAALALLAAVSFVTFVTRSITGPLRKQAAELQTANETLHAEIAERTRAEEELRRSEAQLAAAQKIARIGSWEWDVPSGRMTWSDENYRIHGFESRAFEPGHAAALELVHCEDRRLSDTTFKRALEDGTPFSLEQRILWRDGTERIVHQRGDVVLGSDGRAAKVFGTTQDVTEQKQAEQKLERVHRQLLDVSRQAGMAEVATGVLHNVGNVLNSVNVASCCMADNLRKSKAGNVSKVVGLLREHQADLGVFLTSDANGKQIPGYLAQLAEHLAGEQARALKELAQLQKNIEHIKDIVTMQQSYARISGVTETVQVSTLVEDALRMNASALVRHDVEAIREFAQVPPIAVEKNKVLQILVNLVRNAKQACDESGRPDKQITVRVANSDARVQISVADNGVGIPPENLTRIFNHGFTTRKDGHGFGLHSGALTARELGGSLSAHSEGPGHGATFTVELPLHPPQRPVLPAGAMHLSTARP